MWTEQLSLLQKTWDHKLFEKFQIRQVSGGLFSHLPPITLPVNWPPKPPIWHLRNVELELLGSRGKTSQAPPCFAVRSGMEVRLFKKKRKYLRRPFEHIQNINHIFKRSFWTYCKHWPHFWEGHLNIFWSFTLLIWRPSEYIKCNCLTSTTLLRRLCDHILYII